MARFHPITNEGAGHPLRRRLPPPLSHGDNRPGNLNEDLAFFLVSYAAAFVILYGFVI